MAKIVRPIRQIKNPKLILYPVVSSNIKAIGRMDTSTFVFYKSGLLYEFKDMAEQQYLDILNAESIGKTLHATGLKGVRSEIPCTIDTTIP